MIARVTLLFDLDAKAAEVRCAAAGPAMLGELTEAPDRSLGLVLLHSRALSAAVLPSTQEGQGQSSATWFRISRTKQSVRRKCV